MKNRLLLMIALSALASWPAAAATKDNAVPMKPDIAAVVGSEIISTYDLENRIKFIIISSRLSATKEVAERLRPQVIRTLIDEKIELIDARRNGITITDDEVNGAISGIEKDRGIPAGTVFEMLKRNGLPKETFSEQIRAQLAWRKLVLKKLRPGIRISDEEAAMAKLAPSASAPQEMKISVLTLPVDKPSREKEVQQIGQKLAKELRGGASFEEVTRQLAGRAARSTDEEAFWVRPEQLDPVLARALATATTGTITEPVRNEAGFTIVKVYETRSRKEEAETDSEVTFKEILLKLKPSAPQQEADALLVIAEEVAKHPGSCDEKGIAGIDDISEAEIDVRKRSARFSELPPAVRTITAPLQPGEISQPFVSNEGIALFMLCDRKQQPVEQADLERIKNQIFQQKIELEAQKYLRNLRRDTFIEIRI